MHKLSSDLHAFINTINKTKKNPKGNHFMLKYVLYVFCCILHLFIPLCVSMHTCIPKLHSACGSQTKTCKRWFFPVVLGINSGIRLAGKSTDPTWLTTCFILKGIRRSLESNVKAELLSGIHTELWERESRVSRADRNCYHGHLWILKYPSWP